MEGGQQNWQDYQDSDEDNVFKQEQILKLYEAYAQDTDDDPAQESDLGYHSGNTARGFASEAENENKPPSRRPSLPTNPPKKLPAPPSGSRDQKREIASSAENIIQKEEFKEVKQEDQATNEQESNSNVPSPRSEARETPYQKSSQYESAEGETYMSETESEFHTFYQTKGKRLQSIVESKTLPPTAAQQKEESEKRQQMLIGMPSGFRVSNLALLAKGNNKLAVFLTPRVHKCGMKLKDMSYDMRLPGLAPYPVKTQFQVTVEMVKPMPLPGPQAEVEILSRRLRVCLVDSNEKNPYVSNVHTLNAVWGADSPLVWKFPAQRGVFLKFNNENSFVVRTDIESTSLGLLFECAIVCKKIVKGSPMVFEISCGHCIVPLYKPNKALMDFGSKDIHLSGGETFEKDIPLQQEPIKSGILKRVQVPTISAKFTKISDLSLLNKLPATIIVSMTALPLVSIFREVLADVLVQPGTGQLDFSLCPLSDPVIVPFLQILGTPDVLDALKAIWTKKQSGILKNKKDKNFIKQQFRGIILRLYPLLYIADLPEDVGKGNPESEEARFKYIQQFVLEDDNTMEQHIVKNMHNFTYVPFTIDELKYDPPVMY